MSQTLKAELYRRMKGAGIEPTKHYREYSSNELRAILTEAGIDTEVAPPEPAPEPEPRQAAPAKTPKLGPLTDEEPIRVDEQGRLWYQEEVRKPAYPKPRGRRVLKYLETGVKKLTVQNGEYVETVEVSGEMPSRPAEVKITLPSYQVGIYKDPRFPFRIHCYNDREGFDLFDVQNFYGGAELVPSVIKRVYIENDLCYDIRSVIRAINEEHRQMMLTGRIK